MANFDCCRYCKIRAIGCHSTCNEYLKAVEENERKKKELRIKKAKNRNYTEMKINNINKTVRRKPKGNT